MVIGAVEEIFIIGVKAVDRPVVIVVVIVVDRPIVKDVKVVYRPIAKPAQITDGPVIVKRRPSRSALSERVVKWTTAGHVNVPIRVDGLRGGSGVVVVIYMALDDDAAVYTISAEDVSITGFY